MSEFDDVMLEYFQQSLKMDGKWLNLNGEEYGTVEQNILICKSCHIMWYDQLRKFPLQYGTNFSTKLECGSR